MTKDKFKIQQGNCPNCNSIDLDYIDTYPDNDDLVYEFECLECGVFGNEYYTLSFDGMSVQNNEGDFYPKGTEMEHGKLKVEDE